MSLGVFCEILRKFSSRCNLAKEDKSLKEWYESLPLDDSRIYHLQYLITQLPAALVYGDPGYDSEWQEQDSPMSE